MLTLLCSRQAGLLHFFGFFLLGLRVANADSATWDLNPSTTDWNAAANWTPMTVPNGPSEVATFSLTNKGAVDVSAETLVGSIVFTADADAYTVTAQPGAVLTIGGAGLITNRPLSLRSQRFPDRLAVARGL